MTKPYVAGAVIGAVIGSAVGYLFFTDSGRRQIEAWDALLDRVAFDVDEFRALWRRIYRVTQEYRHPLGAVAAAAMGGDEVDAE